MFFLAFEAVLLAGVYMFARALNLTSPLGLWVFFLKGWCFAWFDWKGSVASFL